MNIQKVYLNKEQSAYAYLKVNRDLSRNEKDKICVYNNIIGSYTILVIA